MKVIIALSLTVIVLTGLVFLTPSIIGQKSSESPTHVKKGVTTQDEREFSKEYKKLYSGTMITKLSELARQGNARHNVKELVITVGQEAPFYFGNEPKNREQFLSSKACGADAIVIATTESKVAHLVEDETFVYTEYKVMVRDILKNNSAFPISVNDYIAVTRPGGLIRLDGQNIRIVDENIAPLELKKEYALFLRYVPTANGYMPYDFDADFAVERGTSRSLARRNAVPAEVRDLNQSRASLAGQIISAGMGECRKELMERK